MKLFCRKKNLKDKFTEFYHKNSFNGKESVSGNGSDLIQTANIRVEIPRLLEKLNIKCFIDAPCGDFNWMRHVDINSINYIGIDIVNEIIIKNTELYGNVSRNFICKNIVTEKLPDAELILIRDCWVHLNNKDIFKCIMNIKQSNIKYLLTTSFTHLGSNQELTNIWRPLNLYLPPFNLPAPIEVINEGCTEDEGIYADKSLILWEVSKLPNITI
jgi:hypothetical protein